MFANIQKRIHSIDIVRGIVMIIMVLDHTRDLLHIDFPKNDPLDYNTTTPLIFITRLITHLCAPTFVFLSGVSAYLNVLKENNIKKSRLFLFKRGLWLIFLEFTIIGFGIIFDIHFRFILLQVIGVIGIGFIALGLLLSLDAKSITGIGILILLLHNLIDFAPQNIQILARGWFITDAFPIGNNRIFAIGYPPIPWIGIMLVGFGSGILFLKEQFTRKKIFIQLGLLLVLSFFLLRFLNIYGNQTLWEFKKTTIFTVLSFFDLTKYPPSLLFALFFLGIMFLLLAFFEKNKYSTFTSILEIYGSVPLFFYIIHWYILQFIKYMVLFLQGFSINEIVSGEFGRPNSPNGFELWGVYIVWIIVILLLYPLCKKYSDYKRNHKDKLWLRYL